MCVLLHRFYLLLWHVIRVALIVRRHGVQLQRNHQPKHSTAFLTTRKTKMGFFASGDRQSGFFYCQKQVAVLYDPDQEHRSLQKGFSNKNPHKTASLSLQVMKAGDMAGWLRVYFISQTKYFTLKTLHTAVCILFSTLVYKL